MNHKKMRLAHPSSMFYTRKEFTMVHTTVVRRVLILIGVLVLLGARQAGSVSAGSSVWSGSGPEAGNAPALQTFLPPTTFDVTICDDVSEIPPSECEALVFLYESTNGSGWTRQDGWLATTTPCSWTGVLCEAGHVQTIYLPRNRLNGSIPPELGSLTNLKNSRSVLQPTERRHPARAGQPGQPGVSLSCPPTN